MLDLWRRRGLPEQSVRGGLGLDPLGRYAASGGTTGVDDDLRAATDLAQRAELARGPGTRRRRHPLPRRRSERGRRGGAGRRHRDRLPARPRRRGHEPRRCARPGRGAPCGQRQPVLDHRQAARRPPGARPRRRGGGGLANRTCPTAARGDVARDAHPLRPLGEPAAHHRCRVRCRCRRCRRGDGRPARPDAARRRAGGTRHGAEHPSRPQRPDDPHRGVAPGPRHRPRWRLVVRRAAHRRPCHEGLGAVRRDRAIRRRCAGAARRNPPAVDHRGERRAIRSASPAAASRSPA